MFVILTQAVPLLAQTKIRDSQAAAARGDVAEALDAAEEAHDIQPWAASPQLQHALAEEQAGSLQAARGSILQAIDDDRVGLASLARARAPGDEARRCQTRGPQPASRAAAEPAFAAVRQQVEVTMRRSRSAIAIVPCLLLLALLLALPSAAPAARPLQTAVDPDGPYSGADATLVANRLRAAGASGMRVLLNWREVAPDEFLRPASTHPTPATLATGGRSSRAR